jgi:hypothetical protein
MNLLNVIGVNLLLDESEYKVIISNYKYVFLLFASFSAFSISYSTTLQEEESSIFLIDLPLLVN